MMNGKLVWLMAVTFTLFEGRYCSNSTQNATRKTITFLNATLPLEDIKKTSEINRNTTEAPTALVQNLSLSEFNTTSANLTKSELIDILYENSNSTTSPTGNYTLLTNCSSSVNLTCFEQSLNDTFKTNYTTVAEAVGSTEEIPDFRLPNWAAIAAGIFLVSAALGYLSCVVYRRYLLKKYGNSQILIGEEVYDTTDLRNFEI